MNVNARKLILTKLKTIKLLAFAMGLERTNVEFYLQREFKEC